MARLSFPTNREVACPLLIHATQLETLDEIVDRYIKPLRDYRDKTVEARTEREIKRRLARGQLKEDQVEAQRAKLRELTLSLSSRLARDNRLVTLYLTGGREVQAERFSEAINQPVGEEVVVGFAQYLTIGEVRASVRLRDERWNRDLSIDIEPNDPEVAQEFFGALNNWATDVEAPKWQQKWVNFRWVFGLLLFIWLFFGLIFIPLISWEVAGQRASRAEARKLLAEGISASSERRALELLLAIESGYDPGVHSALLGVRYWAYVVTGGLTLACTVVCPTVCIGVWKGKQRVRRWRGWIKTVTVTIPMLLLGSAILPWILHLVGLTPPNQ